MYDINAKLAELAQSIDGQVVNNQAGLTVCVKGIVAGFPVALEAIKATYPFGVSYFLETNQFAGKISKPECFKLTIMPKYMQGWLSLVSRILLFESRGQKLNLPELDRALRFQYDNGPEAKRFAHYPGAAQKILDLEKISRCNEMLINSGAGIYLSQPTAFIALDLNVCKEIFIIMAQLGQILFEAF